MVFTNRRIVGFSMASVAAILIAAVRPAHAAITVTVYPSLAPNAYGSPNWAQYETNAISGIGAGGTATGTGASQYQNLGDGATIPFQEAVVTDFSSWLGVAAPNTPAYSGEYGNRMTFGVDIKGNGELISIGDLSFSAASTDPSDTLGFAYSSGPDGVGYSYSSSYVGVIYGTDGGPDTYVTSGPNTQLVDEIIGRGSGNSLAIYSDSDYVDDPTDYGTDPFPADATDQERIDGTAGAYGITSDFDFTGAYTIDGVTGGATVTETVPEPTSLSLLTLGGAAVLRRRRRI